MQETPAAQAFPSCNGSIASHIFLGSNVMLLGKIPRVGHARQGRQHWKFQVDHGGGDGDGGQVSRWPELVSTDRGERRWQLGAPLRDAWQKALDGSGAARRVLA